MRKLNKKWLFAISAIMVGSMAAVSGCGATEEPASVVESEAAVQTLQRHRRSPYQRKRV